MTFGERPSLMSATGKMCVWILPRNLPAEVHRVLRGNAGESTRVRDRVDDRHVRVVGDLPGLRDLPEDRDLLAVSVLDGDDDLRILQIAVLEPPTRSCWISPVRRPATAIRPASG